MAGLFFVERSLMNKERFLDGFQNQQEKEFLICLRELLYAVG